MLSSIRHTARLRAWQRRVAPPRHQTSRAAAARSREQSHAPTYPWEEASGTSRRPRFFVDPARMPTMAQGVATLEGGDWNHAVKSLRLKEGDRVELCDGAGRLAQCQVAAISKRDVTVVALEDAAEVAWSGPRVELVAACATLKGGRGDWLFEKATELGAWSIRALETERSRLPGGKRESRPALDDDAGSDASGAGRQARWGRLVHAANQQSMRVHGTRLMPTADVAGLCDLVRSCDCALLAGPSQLTLAAALAALDLSVARRGSVMLIVGPEGDFTSAEAEAMVAAGARVVSLGPLRLRTETAAIAMLAATRLICDGADAT